MVQTVPLAAQIDKLTRRLSEEFSGSVPDDVVRGLVSEVYGELAASRVTQFVPVLVDRGVRQRLRTYRSSAAA
ncbi:MAG: hypothetical protein JO214_16950 [Frankiaceae bacterium]|nr:hypothetical protein [Frankiaceae bacterium]